MKRRVSPRRLALLVALRDAPGSTTRKLASLTGYDGRDSTWTILRTLRDEGVVMSTPVRERHAWQGSSVGGRKLGWTLTAYGLAVLEQILSTDPPQKVYLHTMEHDETL